MMVFKFYKKLLGKQVEIITRYTPESFCSVKGILEAYTQYYVEIKSVNNKRNFIPISHIVQVREL